MPGSHRSMEGKRLTQAGLITVTVATLLMMAWAIFPTAALASTQITTWSGNGGQFLPCSGGTTLWILAGFGSSAQFVSNVQLTVNGSSQGQMQPQGNIFRLEVSGPGTSAASTTASASWTWDDSKGEPPDAVLTISHCEAGTTTTTTPTTTTTTTPPKGRIVINKQTLPNGDPTTFTFTGEINATLGDGQSAGKDVAPGTYTVSEVVPGGWFVFSIECNDANSFGSGNTATFNVEAGETVRCTFTNKKVTTTTTTSTTTTSTTSTTTTPPTTTSTTSTTTTPPIDTTTTGSPTIGPTTVQPSTTGTIAPTTVRPGVGGTAFTGVENVVPLGTIALILMTAGSGMLWAGSRRRKDDDED